MGLSKLSKFVIGPAFLPGVVMLAWVPFLVALTRIPLHGLPTPPYLFFALLISVGVHELAHASAAKFVGVEVKRLRLTLTGPALELGRVSFDQSIKIASAGPASNLLLAITAAPFVLNPFALWVVLVSLFLYLLNALPGWANDGSRVFIGLAAGSGTYAYAYALSLPISTFPLVVLLVLIF